MSFRRIVIFLKLAKIEQKRLLESQIVLCLIMFLTKLEGVYITTHTSISVIAETCKIFQETLIMQMVTVVLEDV